MNSTQMAQQLKFLLQNVTWLDGRVVFGEPNVIVVAGVPPEESQLPESYPHCLVNLSTGVPDPFDPDFIMQDFSLVTAVEVAGDPMGEHAIIGGSKAPLTGSANRGVLEVEALVRSATERLTGANGAAVQVSASRISGTARVARGYHIARSEIGLTALCTSAPYFEAPQVIQELNGVWTWDGGPCSSRFDFVDFALTYKIGSAPQNPNDGTIAYAGRQPTVNHARVSGATYTIFARYNSRDRTTPELGAHSRAITGTVRAP